MRDKYKYGEREAPLLLNVTIQENVLALGVRHLIVCGHTNCGAMSALFDPDLLRDVFVMRAWLTHAEATAMTHSAGDFYIFCPDDDVDGATDEKHIRWHADDIILNRPALSSWNPDYAEAFAKFLKD